MFIPIPGSVGRLTGWKAIVALVVILSIIGLSVWASLQPHSIIHGTWDIEPGRATGCSIDASKTSRMRVEVEPQTPGAGDTYAIFILDEANQAKLTAPNADLSTISKIAETEGAGTLKIPQVSIGPGTYYVIAENRGKSRITLKYNVYELSN
ncbi:MAG TPA: hypothetical protein VGN88_04090 [Phycisphaerae bacterium]|jgi:hypothetical protein